MGRTRGYVGAIAAVALWASACGGSTSDDAERHADEERALQDAFGEHYCGCYWEMEAASEAECLAIFGLPRTDEPPCQREAAILRYEANPAQAQCFLDAQRASFACRQGFGCPTQEQIDECNAAGQLDSVCGSGDLCFGIEGDDLTECRAKESEASELCSG
jgi:hypothetical protein